MTSQQMVELIKQRLSQAAGTDQVTVDGMTVKFNRAALLEELAYWERKAALDQGKRTLFRSLDLSSGW